MIAFLLGLIIGGVVFGGGFGTIGLALGHHQGGRTFCTCKHGRGFHEGGTGRCHGKIRIGETGNSLSHHEQCGCQLYDGPPPESK